MNMREITKFIEKNKIWIGWGNWSFIIKRVKTISNGYAQIEVTEIGKQFILTLSDEFMSMNDKAQCSILLHELEHGRENVRQLRIEEYTKPIIDNEEELFMNDVEKLTVNWRR